MDFIKFSKIDNRLTITLLGIKMKFRIEKVFGYKIVGKNNKIIVVKNGKEHVLSNTEKIKGLTIDIIGDNNYIKIDCDNFINSYITLRSSNSEIIIDKTDRMYNFVLNTCCGNNQKLHWGKGSNTWGTTIYLNEEGAKCIVGEDCMFSGYINIWGTDGHAIQDLKTKKVLNSELKGVEIGNHCWIGQFSHFTKNAIVRDNTVVGARSVVTKKFGEENIIIAGNPAKIVKQNITWDRGTATIVKERQMLSFPNAEVIENVV